MTRHRFDRLSLASLLLSGFGWLFLLSPPWSTSFGGLDLFLMGAAYVIPGSLLVAALHAREHVSLGQELVTLGTLWLVAVLIWSLPMVLGVDVAFGLVFGLWIATPCFVVWQLLALAIRAVWRWGAGPRVLAEQPRRSV